MSGWIGPSKPMRARYFSKFIVWKKGVLCAQPLAGHFGQVACRSLPRSALRQRLEEQAPILFGQHAPVQNRHDTAVRCAADQTPKALTEFEDRFRQVILVE